MRKVISLELVIVFATLLVTLTLTFGFNGITVEEQHKAIGAANAYRSIVFDLKAGQHVSGSLNYTGEDSGTWFAIYDPDGNHLVTADNMHGNHTGTFSFTAILDGKYTLGISKDTTFYDYIDYEYAVSPAFLGLGKTELILIVIAIGTFLAVLFGLYHIRVLKNRAATQKMG
jgi:hypothetical protein